MRQGAAAGAHGVDVDHRQRNVAPLDLAAIGNGRLAILDERNVAGRAAHVEGDEVLNARRAAGMDTRGDAAGRSGKHRGNGLFRRRLEGRHAAVRLHDVFLRGHDAGCFQPPVEIGNVACENRLEVSIDDRRREPVILADLRDDLARQRHAATRDFFLDDLSRALLVLGREKGEQQADGDRLHVLVAQFAHGLAQGFLVERQKHLALEGHTLGRLAGAAGRHQHGWPVIHDVEDRRSMRTRLFGHFVDTAKALGHEQSGPHALAFEQGIGAHCRAVTEIVDIGGGDATRDQFLDAGQNGARRIVRGRRKFGDCDFAGFIVHINEVGKSSACVHAGRDGMIDRQWQRLGKLQSFCTRGKVFPYLDMRTAGRASSSTNACTRGMRSAPRR